MTVFTTTSTLIENNIVYFKDADGRDFYEAQLDFSEGTIKALLENDRIVAYSLDVSALAPKIGQTVTELALDYCSSIAAGQYVFDGVLAGEKPDSYHEWNGTAWEMSTAGEAQKQADADMVKQSEIAVLLTQAAQKISEYQDLKDFADTDDEMAAGEAGYNAWRQYRAQLLKYQKGLIAEMPVKPE